MEVVGQYFKLLTNYQVDNRIKYSGKWDIKHDISEQYLNSMIIALNQRDVSKLYEDRGDLVFELLYNILNKYCVIEDLKLGEFEEYCNKMDYFTVAARIISQWMTTAHEEWRCIRGSRDK